MPRRHLYHSEMEPCIEAAHVLWENSHVVEVEVTNVDTGRSILLLI